LWRFSRVQRAWNSHYFAWLCLRQLLQEKENHCHQCSATSVAMIFDKQITCAKDWPNMIFWDVGAIL
jgi:hypothetical protein